MKAVKQSLHSQHSIV